MSATAPRRRRCRPIAGRWRSSRRGIGTDRCAASGPQASDAAGTLGRQGLGPLHRWDAVREISGHLGALWHRDRPGPRLADRPAPAHDHDAAASSQPAPRTALRSALPGQSPALPARSRVKTKPDPSHVASTAAGRASRITSKVNLRVRDERPSAGPGTLLSRTFPRPSRRVRSSLSRYCTRRANSILSYGSEAKHGCVCCQLAPLVVG